MSHISETKCSKCDRMYSGTHGRCPYCGGRRTGRGKYSDEADNTKGKMMIMGLLAVVLVVATAVLIFTSEEPEPETDIPLQESLVETPEPENNIELEPNDHIEPLDDPDATDDPDRTPPPEIRSLTITYNGRETSDFTAKVDEVVPLRVRVEPVGVEGEPIWTSSDRSVFEVVKTNTEGTQVNVKGIGRGTAKLTVTVGDITQECWVRVN